MNYTEFTGKTVDEAIEKGLKELGITAEQADIRVLEVCAERFIEVDYTGIDSVQKYISTHTCSLLSTDYGEKVRFRLALKKAGVDVFCSELVDYMQGRVEIAFGKEYYRAFPID